MVKCYNQATSHIGQFEFLAKGLAKCLSWMVRCLFWVNVELAVPAGSSTHLMPS